MLCIYDKHVVRGGELTIYNLSTKTSQRRNTSTGSRRPVQEAAKREKCTNTCCADESKRNVDPLVSANSKRFEVHYLRPYCCIMHVLQLSYCPQDYTLDTPAANPEVQQTSIISPSQHTTYAPDCYCLHTVPSGSVPATPVYFYSAGPKERAPVPNPDGAQPQPRSQAVPNQGA